MSIIPEGFVLAATESCRSLAARVDAQDVDCLGEASGTPTYFSEPASACRAILAAYDQAVTPKPLPLLWADRIGILVVGCPSTSRFGVSRHPTVHPLLAS